MKRLLTVPGGAVPAAMLVTLLPAATASAEIKSFDDPAHDVHARYSNVDIGRVVVQHSRSSVRVRLFPADGRNASTSSDGVTNLWFDTDASRPGPEFGAILSYGGEKPAVDVYRAFKDSKGFHVIGGFDHPRCTLISATFSPQHKTSQSIVPRRCLDYPARITSTRSWVRAGRRGGAGRVGMFPAWNDNQTPAPSVDTGMKRIPTALRTAVPAALLVALVPAGAASAEIRSFHDPANDSGGFSSDIGKVVVQHAPTFVLVKMFPAKGDPGSVTGTDSFTDIWIDTDGRRPGPEYRVRVNWDTERTSVSHAYRDDRGFHARGGEVCAITTTRYRPKNDGTTQVVVPRGCLDRPDRVRVNVTLTTEQTIYPSEYAPGKQRFGPWTHVG